MPIQFVKNTTNVITPAQHVSVNVKMASSGTQTSMLVIGLQTTIVFLPNQLNHQLQKP